MKPFTDIHIIESQNLEKGIQKGIEQGIEQGIEKGALKKSIEIAKSMKKDGINIEVIMKYSSLTIEQINEL